jgi:hypothetical protein
LQQPDQKRPWWSIDALGRKTGVQRINILATVMQSKPISTTFCRCATDATGCLMNRMLEIPWDTVPFEGASRHESSHYDVGIVKIRSISATRFSKPACRVDIEVRVRPQKSQAVFAGVGVDQISNLWKKCVFTSMWD